MKKTTFVLSLVLLTLLASVFGASAATSFTVDGACASTAPPVCDIGGNTYKTIQGAIDAATAGDTINVLAGTYVENLAVNKGLSFAGPNAGKLGQGTRDPEAIIQGLVTVTSPDVIIVGFTITNPGGTYAIYGGNGGGTLSNYSFVNNIITVIGSSTMTQNVKGIYFTDGPDDIVIAGNLFDNLQANSRSVTPVNFGDSGATDPATGLVISNNVFRNIISQQKGAYGILLNGGGYEGVIQAGAGAPGAVIENNSFDGLSGGWTHAIGLEAPTANAVVSGNQFSNLTTPGTDGAAIFFENNPDGGTVTVESNRFLDNGFFGVAVHFHDFPLGLNGLNYTVTAEDNWWNAPDGPSDPGIGNGATGSGAPVGLQIDFDPWLVSQAIYDSVPLAYPGSFPSQPFQAEQTAEFGDHVAFASNERVLETVVVSMTDWACENDYTWDGLSWVVNPNRTAEGCLTTPGSGFNHDITLTIYEVDNSGSYPAVGPVIISKTESKFISYRPSADTVNCTSEWFDPITNKCMNGYAFNIEFDFSADNELLPNEVIFGIAYNTQTWGYAPIGSAGPYNSLNVSLATVPPEIGTDVEDDTTFWNTDTANWYCDDGAAGTNTFRRDGTCWAPYVPAVEFYATSASVSTFPAEKLIVCDTPGTVTISLNNVANLYGYEIDIDFDETVVTGSGTYLDEFFDTTTGSKLAVDCTSVPGTCTYIAVQLDGDGFGGAPVSGSGPVVTIDLAPIAGSGGVFDLEFSKVELSDLDGYLISSTLPDPLLEVSVCGQVDITGNVRLQGRATPMNSGTVRLIDTDGNFGPYTATFDANGDYSFSNVDALPGGSNYRFEAAHDLYISNADDPVVITPGTYTTATTRLLGGDADLLPDSNLGGVGDQKVEVTDIACIASFFGPSAAPCGGKANSSTDINNDTITNIQDLSIAGGNYFKYSFLPW